MKVIDLLNKIANGEEVPHFKIFEIEYFLNDRGVLREKEEDRPSEDTRWFIDSKWLNTEVEIVEEDKKIEKIDLSEWGEITYSENWKIFTDDFNRNCSLFVNKINEIIDKLNKGE